MYRLSRGNYELSFHQAWADNYQQIVSRSEMFLKLCIIPLTQIRCCNMFHEMGAALSLTTYSFPSRISFVITNVSS